MPGARDASWTKTRLYLIIILVAATAVTALSTFFHYRSSLRAAKSALELQALGIAASLEASLVTVSPHEANVFKELIAAGRWEGIAFVALYDLRGTTVLHSNENLIGRHVDSGPLRRVAERDEASFEYMVLGTGEKVFVVDYPLDLRPGRMVLRLALHTHPVEAVTRQALLQIGSIAVLIALLWAVGFFFMRAFMRAERLKQVVEERERLALIGEMASVLAHEIRNPLGSIKGFAQFILEEEHKKGGPDDLMKEYLGIIVTESGRLEALTEDLLSYARPVEVRRASFNVRELVDEVLIGLLTSAREGGVAPRNLVGDIVIESDRDKVKQILTNIVENALDATFDRGDIEVTGRRTNHSVMLTVSDGGCGMAPETIAQVFTPFFTTKTRGTGLGLAIVERLVKALGGTIGLESEPGKGTRCTVTLPLRV